MLASDPEPRRKNAMSFTSRPLADDLSFGARITGISLKMLEEPKTRHDLAQAFERHGMIVHVSPYMAEGILGEENAQGDALLEEVCQTINQVAKTYSYHHRWKPTEMVIWDNWRMLHAVSGNRPEDERVMYRTTIKGDYGLGRFEKPKHGATLAPAPYLRKAGTPTG
jgi:taurine dioxygenase